MAVTRLLAPAELSQLVSTLSQFPLRDQTLVFLTLRTGYRVSEVLSLTIGDVWHAGQARPSMTVERRHLKFGRGERRTSVRSRTVPIGPSLAERLGVYVPSLLAAGYAAGSPLFPSRKLRRSLQRCQALRILHRVFTRAGIQPGGWGMHALRKTFCSALYLQTRDLNLTRLAMGHSSVATTQKYLESSSPAATNAILALG